MIFFLPVLVTVFIPLVSSVFAIPVESSGNTSRRPKSSPSGTPSVESKPVPQTVVHSIRAISRQWTLFTEQIAKNNAQKARTASHSFAPDRNGNDEIQKARLGAIPETVNANNQPPKWSAIPAQSRLTWLTHAYKERFGPNAPRIIREQMESSGSSPLESVKPMPATGREISFHSPTQGRGNHEEQNGQDRRAGKRPLEDSLKDSQRSIRPSVRQYSPSRMKEMIESSLSGKHKNIKLGRARFRSLPIGNQHLSDDLTLGSTSNPQHRYRGREVNLNLSLQMPSPSTSASSSILDSDSPSFVSSKNDAGWPEDLHGSQKSPSPHQ